MSLAPSLVAPASPRQGWRTFVVLWVTQSCSLVGTQVTFFALNIWLAQGLYPDPAQKKALALALSANGFAYALPTVTGALLGGVAADRHDRRRIMQLANFANAIVAFGIVALLASGRMTLPLLLPLTALYALCGAFHASSFDTSYAMLVPRERLPRANGMMQSVWALSALLAPGIAAALVGVFGAHARAAAAGAPAALGRGAALAVAVDAATFAIAGLVLTRLTLPRVERPPQTESARPGLAADLREGWAFVFAHRPLLMLLGAFALANLVFASLGVFQPLLVKFRYATDAAAHGFSFEAALAWLATVGAAGGVAGGVIVSAWGGLERRRVYGVLAPMAISAAMLIGVGLARALFVAAGALALAEGMIPFVNAHSLAIWQARTPLALQGRVFAVRRLIAQFTFPLGTLLAGSLAASLDPGVALAVLGVALALGAGGLALHPAMRHIEPESA